MGLQLRKLVTALRNTIVVRKMKGVTLFNPVEALGITLGRGEGGGEEDAILDLWGANPVRPTARAYKRLSGKLAEHTSFWS
jgi:hypothetical protein